MSEERKRSAEFAKIAIEALEDKKAQDIKVIDISEVSVLADYFIIANGTNLPQIQAMADSAARACGGAKGSAKVLYRDDMAEIYRRAL